MLRQFHFNFFFSHSFSFLSQFLITDYGISMETRHGKIAGDSSQNKNTALPVLANKKKERAHHAAPLPVDFC